MIVDVSPRRLDVRPGTAETLTVRVSNTGDVIGGYTLRVLGADPGWVVAEEHTFSLFPDESREIRVKITVPHGIAAGERRVAVQVRELTPPEGSSIDEVVLVVPEDPSVNLRSDPMAIHAGRKGHFSVLVDNNGNTTVQGRFAGTDPEGHVVYAFQPAEVTLAPGEHTVVDLKVKAKQPWLGSPIVRTLSLYLDDPATVASLEAQAAAAQQAAEAAKQAAKKKGDEKLELKAPKVAAKVPGKKKEKPVVPEREKPPLASATFIQRALIGRGLVSLLGLLAAVSVFAVVITIALSRLVSTSAADRDLALQIATASNSSALSGTSSLGGTVRLLTSGTPVPGVAVTVYGASNTNVPLATTATGADGSYTVDQLPAGSYKITFRGAGFVQLWYPGAVDASDGTTVTLGNNQQQGGLNVSLGGVPATITGTVSGGDVAGATLTLLTPSNSGTTAGTSNSSSGVAAAAVVNRYFGIQPAADVKPRSYSPSTLAKLVSGSSGASGASSSTDPSQQAATGGAIVETVSIGSDGTFSLGNIPSPSVYEVEVSKPGYATSTQLIDVGAGETRTGLNIVLRQGDGTISGTVNSAAGPLGNVTITATSGQSTATTLSLDQAQNGEAKGSFTLRNLPTPASLTIVASAEGYASQTMSLTLASGQTLSGVTITLGASSGQLSGLVSVAGGGPAPGVGVTVTNGAQTVQTATQSSGTGIGDWTVTGLALPGTYTVTFSRSDLASQTVSVSLDASGDITPASYDGTTVTAKGIDITLGSSTAIMAGTVQQLANAGSSTSHPLGEATVTLANGTSSYAVTTASLPSTSIGAYQLEGVPPGTYTASVSYGGVSPTSQIVTLTAGQTLAFSPVLQPAASISGKVVDANGQPVGAGYVVYLYQASQYPSTVYRQTTTASDGTFTFTGLDAPQTYVVEVRPTKASAPTGSASLQLEASQALSNLVVSTQ